MGNKSPNIYWDKIKNTPPNLLLKVKHVGEVLISQHEIQCPNDWGPKEYGPYTNLLIIPIEYFGNNFYGIDDIELFVKKINDFSDNPIVSLNLRRAEQILEDIEPYERPTGYSLDKNYLIKNLLIFIDQIETLREIVSYINKNIINSLKNEDTLVNKITIGHLVYDTDGGIYFKNKLIKMRPQIQNLCILFIKNHKKLVDYSNIKDEIIAVKKRNTSGFTNITKYVNELHKILRKHFKRDVLFNMEKNAYLFDIGKNSLN